MKVTLKKDSLEIKVSPTRQQMGEIAAKDAVEYIGKLLQVKEEVNIVFAAAPSQNDLLYVLASANLEWGRVNAFHMDEYIGLPLNSKQTFRTYLEEHVFSKINFKSVNYIFNNEDSPENICQSYVELLKINPIDIVFMGIGENGHIAFNDPHVAKFDDSHIVKIVELDQKCRTQQVNDGCFAKIDQVPTHAITLTIPTLLSANKIFCVVPAPTKADAIAALYKGTITEECPASILRNHPAATLYCDLDSAKYIV